MYKNMGHPLYKTFSTSILLLGMIFCLHAAQISNYAEMGSALATVPLNAAANFCDSNNNEKRAAQLRMLSNLFSVINKSLFLYNSMYAKWEQDNNNEHVWIKGNEDVYVNNTKTSDYLINTAIALHDLAQIYINFKTYNRAKHQKMQNPKLQKSKLNDEYNDELDDELYNDDLDDLNSDYNSHNNESQKESDTINKHNEQIIDTGRDDSVDDLSDLSEIEELLKNRRIQEAKKPSSVFVQTLKEIILPTLKGSTAFILACMQPNVSDDSGKQIRSVLTATSLLTTLIDDYSLLKPDTGYAVKMPLVLLIAGCTVLLLYEFKVFMNGRCESDRYLRLEITPKDPGAEPVLDPTNEPPKPCLTENPKNFSYFGRCSYCWEDKKLMELHNDAYVYGKKHAICADCLFAHIQAKIFCAESQTWQLEKLSEISCPSNGCGLKLSENNIKNIIGNDLFEKYQAWLKWIGAQAPNIRALQDWKNAKAAYDRYRKLKEEGRLEDLKQEFKTDWLTKSCPECGARAEKSPACQYVQCDKCKTEYCFCCLKKIRHADHRHTLTSDEDRNKFAVNSAINYIGVPDCGFSYIYNSDMSCPYCNKKNIYFIQPEYIHKDNNGYMHARTWCQNCDKIFEATIRADCNKGTFCMHD